MRNIVNYFDSLEDHIRGKLSRYPIIYSIIGGTAIVLFWRGVWDTADEIALFLPPELAWIDGPLSLVVSVLILLSTGLFVSFFISDGIILSGIRQEKKLVEKTETEVRNEAVILNNLMKTVNNIDKEVKNIETKLNQ